MTSSSRHASSALRDLALHARKSSLTIAYECARFRFEESPDLLALMASRGDMGYREVMATVHDILDDRISADEARTMLDPYALSSLARLMTALSTPVLDFTEPAAIARAVRKIRGDTRLPKDAARIEMHTNLAAGQFAHVEQIVEQGLVGANTTWVVGTELTHPRHRRPGTSEEAWLAAFNRWFLDQGLLPVRLRPGPESAFDRLDAEVPDAMLVDADAGPLVTIIMSVFTPDESFRTAVRSLVAQTWRNLEILIVDDCSPPEFDDLLESVAATDPRIRLMRMPVNRGTYQIRNHAIAQSRGEIITFQDSDDWAHPERIERQIAPLLGPTGRLASHATAMRVYGDLTTLKVGYNSFRRCSASMMFRKNVVLAAMGGFDATRKGADTEFAERLDAVFGAEATCDLSEVLMLTQLTERSLSRSEFAFGWHHGSRVAYGDAFRFWHREIEAGQASALLEPGGPRLFPAPMNILNGRHAQPRRCDVIWVSDWRGGFRRYLGSTAQVEAVARAGRTTVVAHAVAVRHADRDRLRIDDNVLRLQHEGLIRFAVWAEPLTARLMIVSDPELLALTRPPESVGLSCDRIVIVAAHPPPAPGGGWWTYDPASIERNAERMFGVAPVWLPAHGAIATALKACGATAPILRPRQLGVVDNVRPRAYSGLRGGSRPIVGTTALELPRRDRPTRAQLLQLLPQGDAYDVRLRADPAVVRAVLGQRPIPTGWLVMDETVPVRAFFRQLDVFIAVPSRSWGPELPWAAVSAMAEGAVVVADPDYRDHLGDAAVYAAAADVHEELKALAADPGRLAEQRVRGYAFCRDVVSPHAAVALVDEFADFGDVEE